MTTLRFPDFDPSKATVIGASTPVGWVWLNGHGPNHCKYDQMIECPDCGEAFGADWSHTKIGENP